MTSTVTLLTDHLGSVRPTVKGTEYTIDAVINVTDFEDALTTTGTYAGSANTFTRTSGTAIAALASLKVGQNITTTDSASGDNDATVTFVSLVGEVLTLSSTTGTATGDEVSFSTDQEVIAYADFGLRTVNQVLILGQENVLLNWQVQLNSDGNTAIADHLVLRCITSSTGAQFAAGDAGTIRVRLVGQI